MKLTKNTILITGGSSGLGLEMARQLTERGNYVIVCGRSQERLQAAQKTIPGIVAYQCDLSDKNACIRLADWVAREYPQCNMLINNAAIVHKTSFADDEDMIAKSDLEIRTNLLAPIALTKLFIPIISQNLRPAIVNITSGLVYVPRAVYPIYNATKAALHSFTQVLRYQMRQRSVSVIEVMFPAVDTPWHKGTPPKMAIPADEAVTKMLKGLEKGKMEIKVGKVKLLYLFSRLAPGFAFNRLGKVE